MTNKNSDEIIPNANTAETNAVKVEIKRRVEFVITELVQEYFLRQSSAPVSVCEVLNKIMILVQYPIAFAIVEKKRVNGELISGERRTFIEDDLFGDEFTKALEGAMEHSKFSPFEIFAPKSSVEYYALYVFAINKGKSSSVVFKPISKTVGYHATRHTLFRQLSYTIESFFKCFDKNANYAGISQNFIAKIHLGLSTFFKTTRSSTALIKDKSSVIDYIPSLNDFYKRFEDDVLEKVYSKKVRNFSVSVKDFTQQKYQKSHSYLPNLILYSKTMKTPGEELRATGVNVNKDSSFQGYNFNTKMIGSKSQREDLKTFLNTLKEGYLNEGGSQYMKSVDIRPYTELSTDDDNSNECEVMKSYDDLFKSILTEDLLVDLDTGIIFKNTSNYTEHKGIDCLLDIYFRQTSNQARSLADSVMLSGLMMIRFPFDKKGGLGLISGNISPIANDASICNVDALALAVTHYLFEGISPLSHDRDATNLAIITFPIYVEGRIPVTASHLILVERESLNDISKQELKTDDKVLHQLSGTWDQVYYLNQYLGKEIKSNFRRGFWQHYMNEMELIIKEEFDKALIHSTEKSMVDTSACINKRFQALTYYYPFLKVKCDVICEPKIMDDEAISFAGMHINISPATNDVFEPSTAGNPYQANAEESRKVLHQALKKYCKNYELALVSKLIFGDITQDPIIDPNTYLSQKLLNSQHASNNQFILEMKKMEWANAHSNENSDKYYPTVDDDTQNFALSIVKNKRITVLHLIDIKQRNLGFGLPFGPGTSYSRVLHEHPINYLEKYYGEFLSYFNGTDKNYLFYEELGLIDPQFRDTLKKYITRENAKPNATCKIETYILTKKQETERIAKLKGNE